MEGLTERRILGRVVKRWRVRELEFTLLTPGCPEPLGRRLQEASLRVRRGGRRVLRVDGSTDFCRMMVRAEMTRSNP